MASGNKYDGVGVGLGFGAPLHRRCTLCGLFCDFVSMRPSQCMSRMVLTPGKHFDWWCGTTGICVCVCVDTRGGCTIALGYLGKGLWDWELVLCDHLSAYQIVFKTYLYVMCVYVLVPAPGTHVFALSPTERCLFCAG